ncbi:MAG: SDR family NAD(P)-dependent oxidoreductase [Pseudomonadales bacterium]
MIEWMKPGNNVVITGGASGIGLAAASRFLAADMRVLISDIDEAALAAAQQELVDSFGEKGPTLLTHVCDVSSFEGVQQLQLVAAEKLGATHCLMNNAGAGVRTASPWEDLAQWTKQVDINLWGIVHGCHAFIPGMLASEERCAVINTGSKQGITNPPGNYAYNMSKAGVKAYTESVAHALRQEDHCRVTAHLLIPGFTYTGMIARFVPEKPAGAWTPKQTVDYMLASLERDEFYILCPDNDTPRELDEKRIQWNVDDLLKNRSALSRWDPKYQSEFEAFMAN